MKQPNASARPAGWQEASPTTTATLPSTPCATESSQSSEEDSRNGGGDVGPNTTLWERLLARERPSLDQEGCRLRQEVLQVRLTCISVGWEDLCICQ